MPRVSWLSVPCIRLDETLAKLMDRPVGELVSYTELTRALHAYIKTRGLKQPAPIPIAAKPPPTVT